MEQKFVNRQAAALEILQNPERFTSLHKYDEFDREFCMWRAPSFEPHSSWSIFRQMKSGTYYLRRLEHDDRIGLPVNRENPHIYGAEVVISEKLANHTITKFESLEVPMFCRPSSIMLDGTQYGVRIGNFWQETIVNWHSVSSKAWLPLAELFDETVALFEALLPTSTLREN